MDTLAIATPIWVLLFFSLAMAGLVIWIVYLFVSTQRHKKLLSRIMPYAAAHSLIESGKIQAETSSGGNGGGKRQDITVMVVDIRGFTPLTEHLPPLAMTELLSDFYETIVSVVQHHHGLVNKFLGDGALILFGVSGSRQETHADDALQCALVLQKSLHKLSSRWQQQKQLGFQTGISMHSGLAFVGLIGPKQMLEYTAIGDTVNLAVAIQQVNKQLSRPILLTAETVSRLQHPVSSLTPLSSMTLKERDVPVTLYALQD
jgi:adenylate cyclase